MSKEIKVVCKGCGNVQRCIENCLCDQKQKCSRCLGNESDDYDREVTA